MTAAPAAAPRDLVGRRLGRYEVLAQLASGGMATVYAARAQGVAGFERLVAIKVLHPHLAHDDEFISMFLDEARLAARIRHPNVVPTLDISDSQGDGYFLVMEYIEGDHFGSLLREAARAGKNLPPSLSLRIVVDALEGLGAAHSLVGADGQPLGIVHRDISPHNIMVGSDGTTRITDFGVAKAEVRMSSTRDGQFKGKLAYMAPEQAATSHADQRSDLFGMAVVLWESLVGRRLFKAENNAELLNRLLYLPIPPPSEYIPELAPLDALLAKALEREPDRRFQTAPEFIEAIETTAAGVGGLVSSRAVGRAVKEYLGTKIEREAGRIREAMESLGRSEVPHTSVPRPEHSLTPSGHSLVRPIGDSGTGSHHAQLPRDPEASTKMEKLDKRGLRPAAQPARNRTGIIVGSVIGASLLGALAYYAISAGDEESTPTEQPGALVTIAAEPTPEATPAPAPPPSSVPSAEAIAEPAVGPPTTLEAPPVMTPVQGHHRRRGGSGSRPATTTPAGGGTAAPAHAPTPPPEDDEVIVNPYAR